MPMDHHRQENLENWNERVPIHTAPDGYPIARLVDDPDAITGEVEFDKEYLGDVSGKTLLHLQCHIGTDTLSWAKLGASVTGLDFSPVALEHCRELADRLGVDATFVESELYDAPNNLTETFDIVYTSVGAINWLPDIAGWARVAAGFVKPGGTFYIRDGHPMLYTLDDERDDEQLMVRYPYFESAGPQTWHDENQTYAGSGTLSNTTINEWNHGLGQTVTALIDAGLRIELLHEHRGIDWQSLPWMRKEDGRWVLPEHQRDLVPLEFSILATKRA